MNSLNISNERLKEIARTAASIGGVPQDKLNAPMREVYAAALCAAHTTRAEMKASDEQVDRPPQCDTCPLKELLEWSLRLLKVQGKALEFFACARTLVEIKENSK